MVAVSSCGGGGGGGPGSTEFSLVIGDTLPLTGASKALGASGQKASDLALERIRSAIGQVHADHTVRTVQQDQGQDADSASAAARRVIDQSGASCLTGPWSADAVGQVARDVAVPSKVLEIAPVPMSQDVTELNDDDLVDSTALPESLEGSALSKAIEEDLGGAQGQTVNLAASSDSYGDTLMQHFIDDWQGKDGSVGEQIPLTPPQPSTSSSPYSAQASQLVSGGPAAVLVIDDLTGFSQLAPALGSSAGWSAGTAWGSDQLVSPGLAKLVGSHAVDGMRALAPGIPDGEDASDAFVRAFQAANPRQVKLEPFAAQEFDATILCYLAAVAAGSTDGQEMADKLIDITAPGGEKFTWQQLPAAIEALQDGKDIDYVGASGPLDMDVHGNPTSGVFDVFRYARSGLEVTGEVPVEKPNPAAD